MAKPKLTKNGAQVKLDTREPRQMEEILKEYSEIKAKAAEAQYTAYVYTIETENLNKQLLSLNQEAAARKQLDVKEEVKPSEEKSDV